MKTIDDQRSEIPQSLLGFTTPPWYYWASLPWTINENFDSVVVTSKKRPIALIAFGVIVLELLLLSIWFYLKSHLGEEIRFLEFTVPNDIGIIGTGLFVTGLVILGFALIALALYWFDHHIWDNPRFVFNKTSNELVFHGGKTIYPASSWEKACIVDISGFIHTPNMRSKHQGVESIYLFVLTQTDQWQKHLIGVSFAGRTSKLKTRKQIDRLQKATKFEAIIVSYPPATKGQEPSIETID